MTYVIDTHPLVWFLEANARLSSAAKTAMADPTAQIIIPTIVLVEIRYLQTAKRIKIGLAEVYEQFFALRVVLHALWMKKSSAGFRKA